MSHSLTSSGASTGRLQRDMKTSIKKIFPILYKKTKKCLSMQLYQVCKRCHDVIQWKITYKKYKPLTVPKKCTKCEQKTIKDAYHIVCIPCGQMHNICCKCGKKEEVISHKEPTYTEKSQALAELDADLKTLPERKRRAYQRYIDKLEGKKKKKKKKVNGDKDDVLDTETEETKETEKPPILSTEEFLKCARQKLNELQKDLNEDDDFLDDLDDLDIENSDDDDDDEDDDNSS
ncbi:unnamed protein product, partial [Meganyctiphanes norvegica]